MIVALEGVGPETFVADDVPVTVRLFGLALFMDASPVLLTVIVTVKDWPVLTDVLSTSIDDASIAAD